MAKATKPRPKKRAITLAGGGPAAGIHIGALAALEKLRIDFDVWSLSCIGAWVGAYYNQLAPQPGRAAQTYEFFREHAFRDTDSYEGFPVNKAFAPNLQAYAEAWLAHGMDPKSYRDAFNFGNELAAAAVGWRQFLSMPAMWFSEGDRNAHVLNNILAVNPMSRFLTSMAYMSGVNGLANIYYKDSSFLEGIRLEHLDLAGAAKLDRMSRAQLEELARSWSGQGSADGRHAVPEIYHNAWRMRDDNGGPGRIQLFNNRWLEYWRNGRRPDYLPITRPSLCACSALPYVEQTVKIPNDDNHEYSEGALVDTVNFRNLVEDHPDLDEIWVCRIVDYRQIRRPENLHDSLGNLCQQFAAEVGENDVELFKTHLRKSVGRTPRVVEIPLHTTTKIDFRWDHENLKIGHDEGYEAVTKLVGRHKDLASATTTTPPWERPD